MILGTGETGMDIAYEAAKAGATEVTLCSRSGSVLILGHYTRVPLKPLQFLVIP